MFGQRLRLANRVADRRQRRFLLVWRWAQSERGRYRKNNGGCSCSMCRGPRAKGKGWRKQRQIELTRNN